MCSEQAEHTPKSLKLPCYWTTSNYSIVVLPDLGRHVKAVNSIKLASCARRYLQAIKLKNRRQENAAQVAGKDTTESNTTQTNAIHNLLRFPGVRAAGGLPCALLSRRAEGRTPPYHYYYSVILTPTPRAPRCRCTALIAASVGAGSPLTQPPRRRRSNSCKPTSLRSRVTSAGPSASCAQGRRSGTVRSGIESGTSD